MGKRPKQDFVVLGGVVACGKCRTEPSLVTRKATFGLCPVTVLPPRKTVVHRLPIPAFRWTVSAARIDRNHRAANAKLHAAQGVVMFRVIGFVRQKPSWPQMGRRLSHGRSKSRGILAGAKTDNGSYDQLGRRMKDSSQLGPCRVCRIAREASALEVDRNVSCFQARGVDRRRVAGIIGDQAARPSTVAASRQQSLEAPFSRSFCSTCHNVE
jgi:hypothetical protein